MKNLKIAGDIIKLDAIINDMVATDVVSTFSALLGDAIITTIEVADSWVNESDENYAEAKKMYGDAVENLVWGYEDEQRNLAIALDFYTAAYEVFKSILTLLARPPITYTFKRDSEKNEQALLNLLTAYVRFDV